MEELFEKELLLKWEIWENEEKLQVLTKKKRDIKDKIRNCTKELNELQVKIEDSK